MSTTFPTPTRVGAALVIALDGPVTGSACPHLRDAILRRLPEGVDHVLIDAGAVTAIDDSVFSVLLAGGAWLRTRGGRIGFLAASASVRRSLAALGLSSLLPVLGAHAAQSLIASLPTESHALHDLQAVVPLTAGVIPAQRAPVAMPVAVAS